MIARTVAKLCEVGSDVPRRLLRIFSCLHNLLPGARFEAAVARHHEQKSGTKRRAKGKQVPRPFKKHGIPSVKNQAVLFLQAFGVADAKFVFQIRKLCHAGKARG